MTDENTSYAVRWSEQDDAYVATVAQFPSLSYLDEDASEALAGIKRVVAEVEQDLAAEQPLGPVGRFPDDTGW
jgi:hypothetical protein